MDHPLLIPLRLRQRDDYLNHAEAVAVEAEFVEVLEDLFENEVLHVLSEAATLEHFPDHMGSLIVLRKQEDVVLKCFSDESFFLGHRHVVEDGLNRVCALLVAADLNEVFLNHVQNLEPLLCRAVREELLEEVVSILIDHYL